MAERRLPHMSSTSQPIFLTWRLQGSLPNNRFFRGGNLSSGQVFVAMDRLLDEARTGPFYLRQPEIADMVAEEILYNAENLGHYDLHAFVVMPNHVHLLLTAKVLLQRLTKSLKGITAKKANAILGHTGTQFWQDESYDHLVRNDREFRNIARYIEENPVRAGLFRDAAEYRWSSAAWATRGSPSRPGGLPH